MMTEFKAVILVVTYLAVQVLSGDVQPTVTLSHGGMLQGLSTTFMDKPVDLFLGVRYAQPPTGKLRFKKPEEIPAWTGTLDAAKIGNVCSQLELDGSGPIGTKYIGDEDCLFLDVTVPGGVKPGAKKPVMVWIHGGGYTIGGGSIYIGSALAVHGGVIMVSINYRLGVLGFLSAGKGTGNYGLWDQRAALLWVKQNIEQFGGDPDMVTIFGESAGGGSVSLQTIGQHNDGLFKRAITQSGTGFVLFGMSERVQHEVMTSLREHTKCPTEREFYDCFTELKAEEILKLPFMTFFVPTADNDFFKDETVAEESYELAHRYDLMAGVNGGEGGLMYAFEVGIFAKSMNYSDPDEVGVSMKFVTEFLQMKCLTQLTPFSANLCADFIIDLYKLDEVADDRDRAARLMEFLGEVLFTADTANQVEQHSSSVKSTYAYYFTELFNYKVATPMWTIPDWIQTTADHGDELRFMFGGPFLKQELSKTNIWIEILKTDKFAESFIVNGTTDDDKALSRQMMTLWTNFAKSGNPNLPVPSGNILWPEFTKKGRQFMELNSEGFEVIKTPHKERLDKIRSHLYSARKLQQNVDQPAPAASSMNKESERDEL